MQVYLDDIVIEISRTKTLLCFAFSHHLELEDLKNKGIF